MSSCSKPDLKIEGGGGYSPPLSGLLDSIPYGLQIKTYCHGELRVCAFPDRKMIEKRQALIQMIRQGKITADEITDVRVERAWREYRQDMQKRHVKRASALVERSKVQDDIQEKAGWGGICRKKRFSANARRVIYEVGALAWQKYQGQGIFMTGTVPGTGAQINDIVARESGYISNRVMQWFRDAQLGNYSVIKVWEFQKRGMLHLHVVCMSNDVQALERIRSAWASKWNDLLMQVGTKYNVDLFRKNSQWTWRNALHKTRQDAQWLRLPPHRYLAKYLSKGARSQATRSAAHPSSWWSTDRRSAKEGREKRIKIALQFRHKNQLLEMMEHLFKNEALQNVEFRTIQVEKIPGILLQVAFVEYGEVMPLVGEIVRQLQAVISEELPVTMGE